MKPYKKQFAASRSAPYLGPFPQMVHCSDVDELPPTESFVSLSRNCRNVSKLPAHKKLKRVHCEFREELLEPLAAVSQLQHLQFYLPRSDKIPSLAPLKQIKTLVLRCNKHQSSLGFVKGMENLHSLCVSEAMGVSRLTPVGSLHDLRELYIDGTISNRNTVESLAPIGRLSELRYALLLLRVDQSNRTLKHLHKLAKLEFLHLADDYDESEYQHLVAKLPRLSEIRFNAGKRWPPA